MRDDPEYDLPLLGCRGEEVIPIPIPELLQVRPWYEARMLDHFLECLRTGKEPEVSVAEARAAMATKSKVESRQSTVDSGEGAGSGGEEGR
jgi:hypothetical protein